MPLAPGRILSSSLQQMRRKSTTASNGLPRLPVPDLRKTLDRYLTSIQPFLLDDAARGGESFDAAFALRIKWADEFEQGVGRVCQERLVALDARSPNNWLNDNIWLDKAYLEWRSPLVINSNWWLVFQHDRLIPENARTVSREILGKRGFTPWQIRRASWMVHRTLQYKDTMAEQEATEFTRTGIWLRESVAKIFNIARIPQPNCDVLSSSPTPPSAASRCILVIANNWFYMVPVYDVISSSPSTGNAASRNTEAPEAHQLKLVSARELERRISSVVRDVQARKIAGEVPVSIGVLSADNRDTWSKNLAYLLSLSDRNQTMHTALQHCLIALSLDDSVYSLSANPSPGSSRGSATQLELDSHVHSIRSTPDNVANRFFDKPYTIIVDPAARAGAMGEHSPVDALIPSIVGEYSVVEGVNEQDVDALNVLEENLTPTLGSSHLPSLETHGFARLDWVTDDYIQQECIAATARAKVLIDNSDDSVLWFKEYGTDWMKKVGLSPDAYIQQALQLAWYKTRGEFTATYETALTRMFAHGRTETIRTLTTEAREFVLAMCNNEVDPQSQLLLLRRAVQRHASLTREAATGRGIDRHLLGLRLMLPPEEQVPRLFSDELFERSSRWKLSTSGLSAGYLFRGTGFGAAYEDGYGINYLAAPDMIKFGVECKHNSDLTSTSRFQKALLEALKGMHALHTENRISENEEIRSHL